ncbi:hypothetical protein [Sulfurimonas sp.]|uniref:hypothetical protein n=1 Tax=Sulfurimonas sp. TaxID=2022749 RepID=UPI0025D6FE57|nr:hypothetical protein [Sulfurimonas sp.]
MFSKMLGKMKESSSDNDQINKELVEKIANMNLTDMRNYVNDRIAKFPVSEDGLSEIMYKLLEVNDKTSKRYINIDDMDSKIKKGFDLILKILINKKITVTTIELVSKYLEESKNIILKYDKDNKQIYGSKFIDSIAIAIENMNKRSELQRKMDIIGS